LRTLVTSNADYPAPAGIGRYASVNASQAEQDVVNAYLKASADRQRATRGMRGGNQKQIDDFAKSIDREGLLRKFVSENGGFGDFAYTPDLGVQSDIAVRAIERGLSHSVMLGAGFQWDTHNNNALQSSLYDTLFTGLMRLAKNLETANLLDHTTVLVLSEMG